MITTTSENGQGMFDPGENVYYCPELDQLQLFWHNFGNHIRTANGKVFNYIYLGIL